jgi:hypothetical protein
MVLLCSFWFPMEAMQLLAKCPWQVCNGAHFWSKTPFRHMPHSCTARKFLSPQKGVNKGLVSSCLGLSGPHNSETICDTKDMIRNTSGKKLCKTSLQNPNIIYQNQRISWVWAISLPHLWWDVQDCPQMRAILSNHCFNQTSLILTNMIKKSQSYFLLDLI